MKSYKNLYPQVCTFENLLAAFYKARRGKRSRPNVADFENELTRLRTYLRLSHDLRLLSTGQYQHAARLADEVGCLLGGWKKVLAAPAADF